MTDRKRRLGKISPLIKISMDYKDQRQWCEGILNPDGTWAFQPSDAPEPEQAPRRPPPAKRKCRHCIHDEHSGMCTGRNGGTAYPCPCFHSSSGGGNP